MKVKELIKRLEQCDPEAYVSAGLSDGIVEIDTVDEYKGTRQKMVWPKGYTFYVLEPCECDTDCACDEQIVMLGM